MSSKMVQRLAAALLLCATLAAAQAPPATSRMTPNFQNQDIALVAEAVGNATGVTFVIDPRVRANITLINSRAMSPQELYETFLSILQVNNYAAVRSGNIVKIVPDSSVRTLPGNDIPERVNPDSDEMVTTVIEVKNVSAAALNAVLRPLVATYGTMSPVPGTNSLLITDRAGNVARMQRIVQRIDRASTSDVDVIRLENASAADIVRTLAALTAGTPADAGGIAPRVVADERSNSVLVSGEPGQRLRLAAWIANLDTPLEGGGGTETIYLKYADAEKLGAKLKENIGGVVATTGGAAGGAQANASQLDRSVNIWSDKQTNALIISAPPKTMRQLKGIIDKLDIPRAQVLVEAIIADVSTTKSADLGINWAVFSNEDGTNVPAGAFISPIAGASIVDLTGAILNPSESLAAGAAVPQGATFGIGKLSDNGFNFGAMIRALRADTNTNVIATPQITTADNQEANFESGQEVPFLTGQYSSTGNNNGGVNPFTTVQRQSVGTKLKITPQLNGSDAMTLTIELESSELAGRTGDAGSAITNVRKFKNTVLVRDGETIVVGGMIRNSKRSGENRVPFLSRIPLIGEAFKVRNGQREESNLMVFLRPRILADSVQATLETNQKYNLIRDAQIKQGERRELLPILPFDKAPQLPPIPEPAPGAPPPQQPAAPATTTPVP